MRGWERAITTNTTTLEHWRGVPWFEAPRPPRGHACRAQTRGSFEMGWPIQRVLSTPRTGREARRMAAEWTVLAAGILLVSAFGGGLFLGVLAGFAAQVVLNAGLSRHDRRLARQWAAGADINVNTG